MKFRSVIRRLEAVLEERQRKKEGTGHGLVVMDFDRREELFREHIKTCKARFHFIMPGFDPKTLPPSYRTAPPRFRRKATRAWQRELMTLVRREK